MCASRRKSSSKSCVEMMVTPHHAKIALSVAHDDVRLAFNQNTERDGNSMPNARRARCSNTKTTPPPIVARNAAEPLIARESTEARITSKTASNGVLCERERLCPSRTMDQCRKKHNDAAQRDLNKCQVFRFYAQAEQSFKRIPKCIHGSDCIATKSPVEPVPILVALARETIAWHKTNRLPGLTRQSRYNLCRQLHLLLATLRWKRASFWRALKKRSSRC